MSTQLSTIERVLFLKRAAIFQQISGRDLIAVAEVAKEVHFASRTTFIEQGDIGTCLYLIVSGEVSVRVQGVGEVARSTTNDLIGEMAIISRQPRSADCVAVSDVTLLQIDYDDFWRLLAGKPNIALGIIRVLSGRLSSTMQSIQERRKNLSAP